METNALLCNHAEAADGKLYVNGGGISLAYVSPVPPHIVSVFVGVVVLVPYTATNQPHTLRVAMHNEDGGVVVPWTPPDFVQEVPGVEVTVPFNIGRPAGITVGDGQTFSAAFGFQLPVPGLGGYVFIVEIDGTEQQRLPLRVTVQPGQGFQPRLG